jgi:selenide,water dikinase
LSKPLGVGILSAALKKERLSAVAYHKMIAYTTQLNQPGIALSHMEEVHALTDVTGFGLAGHLLEMSRGAKLQAKIDWQSIPVISEALDFVKADIYTGASTRNWQAYGDDVHLGSEIKPWQQNLLTDPQTSGGLLIACKHEAEKKVLDLLQQAGFHEAQAIGRFTPGQGVALT